MRLIDADRAMEIVRDQGIAHPNAYHYGVGSANTMKTLMLQGSSIVVCLVKQYGITISVATENGKKVLTDG